VAPRATARRRSRSQERSRDDPAHAFERLPERRLDRCERDQAREKRRPERSVSDTARLLSVGPLKYALYCSRKRERGERENDHADTGQCALDRAGAREQRVHPLGPACVPRRDDGHHHDERDQRRQSLSAERSRMLCALNQHGAPKAPEREVRHVGIVDAERARANHPIRVKTVSHWP
jgi:hypothetical protein